MKQNQTHNQTKPHAVPTFCAELTRLVQRSLPLSLTHFKTHFLCLATEINECSIPEWLIKLHPPSLVTPSIIRTERSISVIVVILIPYPDYFRAGCWTGHLCGVPKAFSICFSWISDLLDETAIKVTYSPGFSWALWTSLQISPSWI